MYKVQSRSFVTKPLEKPKRVQRNVIRKRTKFTISPYNPHFFVNICRAKIRASQYHCELLNTIVVEATTPTLAYTFNCDSKFLVCGKSLASQFFLEPWEQVVITQHELTLLHVVAHLWTEPPSSFPWFHFCYTQYTSSLGYQFLY